MGRRNPPEGCPSGKKPVTHNTQLPWAVSLVDNPSNAGISPTPADVSR